VKIWLWSLMALFAFQAWASVAISTSKLPKGMAGSAYSAVIEASGGCKPYSWTITSGSLPSGITRKLSSTTTSLKLSGSPTIAGTYSFTVDVKGCGGHISSRSYKILVKSPPDVKITTTKLPNGRVGSGYSATIQASGGCRPYSWAITSGFLPAGVSKKVSGTTASLTLSGIPITAATDSFTVSVTGCGGHVSTAYYKVGILESRSGVAITTSTLPNGIVGGAYSAAVKASGGCTPYKWRIVSGALPEGISANLASSATLLTLSGTPTTAAAYSPTLQVTGCGGGTFKASYKIIVQAMNGYLIAPSSMNLGSVVLGSRQTQTLALSNSGGSSLTISGATVSGAGFGVGGLEFPYTLPAGGRGSLSVTFTPSTTGTISATLSLSSNGSDRSVRVFLTGSGTNPSGALEITPSSFNFGSITVGSAQTQTGKVTANSGSVTLSSTSSSNSAFTVGGFTLPVTLAAGQSVPFIVTFAPRSKGTASANISFFTSNSTSALEIASGSGATIQHIVDLSWNASPSPSISGYNVYRGTVTGGPYRKINSVLVSSMSYSDSTVQSDQTYYYVTTAVDEAGIESSYSNQTQAVIPFP
jgi:Abnormal spindle-like microcephaly-assoc'd, ASPM-SPD-2-Hydin